MDKPTRFSLADRRIAVLAFDFIDRVRLINDLSELQADFRREISTFGFKYFLFSRVPHTANTVEESVILNSWPKEWYELYSKNDYVTRDPAAMAVALNILPFTWRDIQQRRVIPGTDPRIFDEVRAWQMNHGFCIPIRTVDGLEAVVTLAGPSLDISDAAKNALHLMAIYMSAKAIELADAPPPQRAHAFQLAPREREGVVWIAAGKSSWEIGEILGLSELTVAAYIKSDMRKLNVVTRAQLVAAALRQGEINL